MFASGSDITLANIRGPHLAFAIPVDPQAFSQGHLAQRPLHMELPIVLASSAIRRDSSGFKVLYLPLDAYLCRDLHLGQGESDFDHAESIIRYKE